MNATFFGLAFLAALNPKLLGVDLLLIQSGRPRPMFACFLSGCIGVALTVGLLDVFVVHADAIKTQGSISAGLDLALGVALLVIGALVATGRLHGRPHQPVLTGQRADRGARSRAGPGITVRGGTHRGPHPWPELVDAGLRGDRPRQPAPQRTRGHRRARVRPGPARRCGTRPGLLQVLCAVAVPAAGRRERPRRVKAMPWPIRLVRRSARHARASPTGNARGSPWPASVEALGLVGQERMVVVSGLVENGDRRLGNFDRKSTRLN